MHSGTIRVPEMLDSIHSAQQIFVRVTRESRQKKLIVCQEARLH